MNLNSHVMVDGELSHDYIILYFALGAHFIKILITYTVQPITKYCMGITKYSSEKKFI